MKKKLALALSMLIATLSASLRLGRRHGDESDAPAPQAEATSAVTLDLLLRTVENIGAELEARQASGRSRPNGPWPGPRRRPCGSRARSRP